MTPHDESEWKTRKRRIDPRLDFLGWKRGKGGAETPKAHGSEEHEPQNGPADYVLWQDGKIVAVRDRPAT